MRYDKEKVQQFNEYVSEDYNKSLVVEDIARVKLVEKTDNSFVQIGIRPLLDDEMFTSPSFDPRLPSAGMVVAIGERDFLINSILNNKEIKLQEFREEITELPNNIEFDDATIIISTKFYVEFFTKLMRRIDYSPGYPRLDFKYKIISVPEKVLGDKIIIIAKDAILWEKQKFYNEIAKRDEKIDIQVKPATGNKVDILLRSVNKIKYLNPKLIKVLEVKR